MCEGVWLLLQQTDEASSKLTEFLLHYIDECLYSIPVSASHTHTHAPRVEVRTTPTPSASPASRKKRHQDTNTHTPLMSDMQAFVPFRAEGSGADETKMDTAAVLQHAATGDTKVT